MTAKQQEEKSPLAFRGERALRSLDRAREDVIAVELDPGELETISRAAEAVGEGLSEYLRRAALERVSSLRELSQLEA